MAWISNLAGLLAQAAPATEVADKAAEAVAQGAAAATTGDAMSGTLRLLIALGIIIGSFVLGALIANSLRMKDYAFRIGVVLFTLFASAAIVYFGWPPKRGIDLSGGVVLVYEVDTASTSADWMPATIRSINESLNAEGGERLEARPVGENRIEVTVPAGVDVAAVEKRIDALRDSASIVLNTQSKTTVDGQTVLTYQADPGAQRQVDMAKLIGAVGRRINPGGVKELTIRQYGADQLEVIIPEVDEREVEQIKKKISTSGLLSFRIVANPTDDRELIRVAERTPGRDVYIGGELEGRWVKAGPDMMRMLPPPTATYRQAPDGTMQILVAIDPFNADGRYLTRASQSFDQRGGMAVDFSFDSVGAEKFRMLTSRNLPDEATGMERHLGIILDGVMLSAPAIQSTISNRGQITGRFTKDEVDVLVGVLNAGSLPASLRPQPISQQRISAQLGDDTIRLGTNAMLVSTALILLFMAVYYRFCGMVANIAVVLNVLMIVALMILIKAAFTLPGLAGLVLTVGMAVDANVLIYERIREETERGASMRMALRNGFSRATSTILDSNITTLISAVVLYVIGTDQIKGFAITLILGLLVGMFTAIYVSRVILDIAERRRWVTSFKMMKAFGETNFNFIRYCVPAIVFSGIILAAGAVAMVGRGKELLDIDFTGGSSVQIAFAEGQQQNIADVREAVADLPDVAVSSVGEGGLNFKIDTSERDITKVKAELQQTFGEKLETYEMSYGSLSKIETPADSAGTPAATGPEISAPGGETPAAPATETPATETPAETAPPAEATPPAEAAPQSNRQRPSPFRFATYLQEEQPAEQPAAEQPAEEAPAADAPASEAPADPPAAEAPATDAPAPETPAAAEQPAEPAAATTETPAATTTETPSATEESQSGGASMVGGTRVELTFPEPIAHDPLADLVQQQLDAQKLSQTTFNLNNPEYQEGSDARYATWTLESPLDETQTRTLLDGMKATLAATPVFPSSSEIGGKVAGDTQLMALYALLASMLMIAIYVWIRFQNLSFGVASVVALIHDAAIATAALALSYYLSPYLGALLVDPFKISLSVVAALLTIVGFSINDTIVIFDRVREVRGKSPRLTGDMINLSVNQTLSRTFITSGTVLIACLILYFVGGPGIHGFAFTMVVGVIAGTYSTIYIAAPLLLWLQPSPESAAAKNEPVGAGSRQR